MVNPRTVTTSPSRIESHRPCGISGSCHGRWNNSKGSSAAECDSSGSRRYAKVNHEFVENGGSVTWGKPPVPKVFRHRKVNGRNGPRAAQPSASSWLRAGPWASVRVSAIKPGGELSSVLELDPHPLLPVPGREIQYVVSSACRMCPHDWCTILTKIVHAWAGAT